MPALLQISINFSAIHPLPKYGVSSKRLGLYKLKLFQPINSCSVSRLKIKSFYKDSFRADASRTNLQFLGVGRGKDGIPVSRGRRVVLAKFKIGSGGGGDGGGRGRVSGETARVVGNLALAILLTYLSMTGQLGWLLDAIVSLWVSLSLSLLVYIRTMHRIKHKSISLSTIFIYWIICCVGVFWIVLSFKFFIQLFLLEA